MCVPLTAFVSGRVEGSVMSFKWSVFASWIVLAWAVAGCAGNTNAGCDTPCASSQVCCEGSCVFNLVDPDNCGACGNVCASRMCSDGMCVGNPVDAGPDIDTGPPGSCSPTCASDERCCGTTCVEREQPRNVDGRPASTEDPRSPFNNCNGCGLRCDPMTAISCSVPTSGSGPSQCMCGDFSACLAGEVCVNDGGRYQCINTSSNTMNCGAIGNSCAPGEACSGGMCVCGATGSRCPDGQGCCGGAGCVDVSSDAMNCGTCGNVCPASAPNCQGGTCVCGTGPGARTCVAPSMTGIGESCCDGMCVTNSDTNCGCGVVCNVADDETCIFDSGFFGMGGTGGVCCGTEGLPPLFPGFCSGGIPIPGGDGGFPFPGGDAGIPFP